MPRSLLRGGSLKPKLEATYSDFGVKTDFTITSIAYGILFFSGIFGRSPVKWTMIC